MKSSTMKYVIVRCEDRGPYGEQSATLLAGAKTPHLHQLAQAGAAGAITFRNESRAIDRARCHRSLLGLNSQDADGSPGRCYAAAANRTVEEGQTAWCCDLVTQRDGRIVDDIAGRITPKESEVLIQALDDALGSETRQWEAGRGRHHVLIVSDPVLGPDAGRRSSRRSCWWARPGSAACRKAAAGKRWRHPSSRPPPSWRAIR